MSPRTTLGSLALLAALLGGVAAAPPVPLDLVPDGACIGISIRDLDDLKAKSAKLLGDRPNVPRFSELFDTAFKELKLGWKVDAKAAAAILCTSGKLGGFANDGNPMENFTVGTIIPFASLEDVARAWKFNPDDVKNGQVVNVAGRNFDRHFDMSHLGVKDRHAYLAGSKRAVEAWMSAKSLRQTQPADRLKRLEAADGLVYLGPPLFAYATKNIDQDWVPDGLTERERQAQKRLNRAMAESQSLLGSFRLDDGLGVDITVGFDPKGKESQALLKALGAGGRTSNLAGLPVGGPVVAAFASAGGATDDADLARAMTTGLWTGWRNAPLLLESDAPVVRQILGRLYGKVKTTRLALYATTEKAQVGPLAAVAVLEATDPAALLKEVRGMARLADVKAFEPKGQAGQAEIAQLVKDLGADDYEAREAATTQLALIGEPALDALAKAEKADDAEVRRRAGELKAQIEQVANLRKQELAKGLLKQAFHPQFAFKEKAEQRAGADVHHLGVAFDAQDAPFAVWMKDLFGPDWNRLRIATVGDKVVILLGSDVGLFDQAIGLARDGKPGLEADAALAAFRKQVGPDRRVEAHVALRLFQQLTTPAKELPPDFKPSPTLSSVALRTGPTDATVEFWSPPDAVGDIFWFIR